MDPDMIWWYTVYWHTCGIVIHVFAAWYHYIVFAEEQKTPNNGWLLRGFICFLSKLGVTYPTGIVFGCGVAHAHARSEVLPPVALQHYKRLRRRLRINQCYAEICSMFWALGMDVWWGCGPLCRTCCCCSMISTTRSICEDWSKLFRLKLEQE